MLSKISDKNRKLENEIDGKIFSCISNGNNFIFNAGAGAGKTYSLVEGLKYLIATKGNELKYHNNKAICITYTNVAAREIQDRLGMTNLILVSTIHERIWELIKNYQPQLVEIHMQKLNKEIDAIINKIDTDKAFEKYKELSKEEREKFFDIMLKNRELFYKNYNKGAVDFRESLSSKLEEFESLIKNVLNFKKIVNALFKLNDYTNCRNSIQNNNESNKIIHYDTRYNTDALHKMRISHDTLLVYAKEIIIKYDILKQIIIDQYPYIFVDEYQDTDKNVIEILSALVEYSNKIKHTFCVGYFGDLVQNIYDTGIGNDINFHTQSFIKINKDFNRRSMQEIIDVANIIRNDNITQCSIYEDCYGGSIKFYEGTSQYIDRFIDKYIKKWHINSENKLHCFVLTNNTVADYSGFSELYNAFKGTEKYTGNNYKSLNTELLSDDIKKLGEVQLIFYKITEIYTLIKKADTQIVDILPRELHRKINLGQLKNFVSTLKKVSGKTMIEYISAIILEAQNDVTGIFEVFVRYIADIERISVDCFKQKITRILFPNEDDISSIEQKIETIFNIDLSVYELWYRFIKNEVNKNVVYHTYHSTKGLEFDNVIIIMENAFGRDKNFFDFYFSKCKDDYKLNEAEQDKFQNIRNLLYVSLTRAVKNLRILYIDPVKDFKTNLEGIFGKVEKFHKE